MNMEFDASLIDGYTTWMEKRVDQGWKLYLVTLMFGRMAGSAPMRIRQMHDCATKLYSRQLTRLVRRPRLLPATSLPIWIGVVDCPVHKNRRKDSLKQIAVNDGLHMHFLACVPPRTRLKGSFKRHMRSHEKEYCKATPGLARIHVRRVRKDVTTTVDYVFKTLKRGRVGPDDVIVLPRAHAELGGSENVSDATVHHFCRSAVGVTALPRNAAVEIEGIFEMR